jgi:hypothetical protein
VSDGIYISLQTLCKDVRIRGSFSKPRELCEQNFVKRGIGLRTYSVCVAELQPPSVLCHYELELK